MVSECIEDWPVAVASVTKHIKGLAVIFEKHYAIYDTQFEGGSLKIASVKTTVIHGSYFELPLFSGSIRHLFDACGS